MASHKSALKRARQNEKRRQRNRTVSTRMKSFVKAAESAIQQGAGQEEIASALRSTEKEIRKAASKGVIHKKTASRKVSRLARARDRAAHAARDAAPPDRPSQG